MVPLFSNLFSFSRTPIMGDKRDAAMAGLSWPPSDRTSPNPRTTGSADSAMIDDIGHETFAPPPPATLSSTTSPHSTHYLHPHHLPLTITTKTTSIMDPGHQALHPGGNFLPSLTFGNVRYTPFISRSGTRIAHLAPSTLRRSTNKELFVNSIRSISFTSLQVTMYKPTRCQTIGVLITASLCITVVPHIIPPGLLQPRLQHHQRSPLQRNNWPLSFSVHRQRND